MFFSYLYIWILCKCLVYMEARLRHLISWNWSYRWLLATRCWESNPGPLEKQPVPETTEHLSSPIFYVLPRDLGVHSIPSAATCPSLWLDSCFPGVELPSLKVSIHEPCVLRHSLISFLRYPSKVWFQSWRKDPTVGVCDTSCFYSGSFKSDHSCQMPSVVSGPSAQAEAPLSRGAPRTLSNTAISTETSCGANNGALSMDRIKLHFASCILIKGIKTVSHFN